MPQSQKETCFHVLWHQIGALAPTFNSSEPEVKRLQSMAKIGQDLFATQLNIEDCEYEIQEIERRANVKHSEQELLQLYQESQEIEKSKKTLQTSMKVYHTTLSNIKNREVIDRMSRVMQETISRHHEMQQDNRYHFACSPFAFFASTHYRITECIVVGSIDSINEHLLEKFDKVASEVAETKSTIQHVDVHNNMLDAVEHNDPIVTNSRSSDFLAWKNKIQSSKITPSERGISDNFSKGMLEA